MTNMYSMNVTPVLRQLQISQHVEIICTEVSLDIRDRMVHLSKQDFLPNAGLVITEQPMIGCH